MDARTAAWWKAVLAGKTDEPHPTFGEHVKVRLHRDRLELRGTLERRKDRQELVRQARSRVGEGVREVDVSHLVVAPRLERSGLLEQTIIASFSDRATAELARKFVREHGRVVPASEEVIDRTNAERLRSVVPAEYVEDVQRRIDRGEAVVLMRVDETAAFTVRGLLEEETRCDWSLAIPPEVAAGV
jgi:hypothetical protein